MTQWVRVGVHGLNTGRIVQMRARPSEMRLPRDGALHQMRASDAWNHGGVGIPVKEAAPVTYRAMTLASTLLAAGV